MRGMHTSSCLPRPPFDPALVLEPSSPGPVYSTPQGHLLAGDCLEHLAHIRPEVVDAIFADPPFNLKKTYGEGCADDMSAQDYLAWSKRWIDACLRTLKPGGALFLYNIPQWNIPLGAYLMEQGLTLRHSIAVEMKNGMPISGKLYPAHYMLLYFTKGKPRVFHKIRTPIETCRHCGGDVRDYGGHRKALHPDGISLKDVWTDIPPVRHTKFMAQGRKANALSTKMLDRVVDMSTDPGDLVLDPFAGSGTTPAVCQKKDRRWLAIEIDFCPAIIARLESDSVHHHVNTDRVEPPKPSRRRKEQL